jgi:phosphocarrier protein HPr
MIEREVMITNKLGLHARASAKLVQLLQGYKCHAFLTFRGREVNAKSIMGVMMLAAGVGNPILLRAEGEDEEAAIAALVDLFARKFDEGV